MAPWRAPGVDVTAYFNYGFNEPSWRKYQSDIRHCRLEMTMNESIQTFDAETQALATRHHGVGTHLNPKPKP